MQFRENGCIFKGSLGYFENSCPRLLYILVFLNQEKNWWLCKRDDCSLKWNCSEYLNIYWIQNSTFCWVLVSYVSKRVCKYPCKHTVRPLPHFSFLSLGSQQLTFTYLELTKLNNSFNRVFLQGSSLIW